MHERINSIPEDQQSDIENNSTIGQIQMEQIAQEMIMSDMID